MDCQNYFCIYQSEGKCCLEEISIDMMGNREHCIYPNIDMSYIKREKDKPLKVFDERIEAMEKKFF